jgi:cupin fold WbuC family metalloprotein
VLNLVKHSPEVYYANQPIVHVSGGDLDRLRDAVALSSRRRSRICTHRTVADSLHEMFVVYQDATYIRPNRHFGKDESIYVLDGLADVIFFNNDGTVKTVVRVGSPKHCSTFYCRIPKDVFHTVVIRSPELVLFEATPGPFVPSDTEYATWAPEERDAAAARQFIHSIEEEIERFRHLAQADLDACSRLVKLDSRVYASKNSICFFSTDDINYLDNAMHGENVDRVRICAHLSNDDRLHEMLMVFNDTTYIRPSLHINKDESLLMIEGLARYVFFDESGRITTTIPLGAPGSGRSFYCRVPGNMLHCLVLESNTIAVKETTSGPFRRSDTVFAPWSPDGHDAAESRSFLSSLGVGSTIRS